MNIIAVLAVFWYVTLTITKGRGNYLIKELEKERAFISWFAALLFIYETRGMGGEMTESLVSLLFISIGLSLLPRIIAAYETYRRENKSLIMRTH